MPVMSSSRDRLITWFDASVERLAEAGLMLVLAVAKTWNAYADRRHTKRGGRRAADHEAASCKKQIARLEAIVTELTTASTRLTARVRALERAAGRKED
jgi:hypothetical protein